MVDPAALQAMLDALPSGAALLRELRFTALNHRALALFDRTLEELLALPDASLLVVPEDRARAADRGRARLRGESVTGEYEVRVDLPSGQARSVHIRACLFPPAGSDTTLLLLSADDERERAARLIRGFADAGLAAQEERSAEAVLRTARERLSRLGLEVGLMEVRDRFVALLHTEGTLAWVGAELERRHGRELPIDGLPIAQAVRRNPHGVLVDDFPSSVAQLLRRPRAEVGQAIPPRAVAAAAPLESGPGLMLVAAGEGLDQGVASAFGLLARQLGAAVDTARRLDELQRSNRELSTVNQVARASATLSSGGAVQEALRSLRLAVDLDAIALFRREEGGLLLAVHAGLPEAWVAAATRVALGEDTPWSAAAASGRSVPFALRGEADAVAIPLRASEVVQGVLVAARQRPPLSPDDLRLLGTVGAQLAVNLQNALLFEKSEQRVAELSLLLELGQEVVGSLDQQQILATGTRVAARILRASAAYLFLPAQGRLVCAAFEDPNAPAPSPDQLTLDLPGASLSALAFLEGRPQRTGDASADPRIDPRLIARYGCRATLAVPLLSHDRPLGVLLLIERRADRAFDDQAVRLASHAAQLLAASLANAALYAEQRQRAEELALLAEVSRSLAGSLEVEPLLQGAAETLRKLLGAGRCFILLLDEQRQVLSIRGAPGAPAEQGAVPGGLAGALRLDQPSAAATAVRERRAVQLTGAEPTVLAVPLIARDEVVGAVVLDDARSGRVFAPHEVERALGVAGQIALALLSARLFEDLRRSYGELERAQAELIDRERLAALGELSASIAHEVRNPLGVIFNALGSLRRLLKAEGNTELLLRIIAEEADRLNDMVGDLLDYSRPLKPSMNPLPLLPLVGEALDSALPRGPAGDDPAAAADAGPAAPGGIELEVQIPPELTLRGDGRLLRQAFVNLFLNARQAMPRGGRLSVQAERVSGLGNPRARILVRDSGPGIAPEALARVFQPFFTTKATGTGLGLAVVRRIVEGHGGRIEAGSVPGSGARFELWLPVD